MSEVLVKRFKDIPLNVKEISRYYTGNPNKEELIDFDLINQNLSVFSYNVIYTELPVVITGSSIDFSAFKVQSKDLAKNLKNAKKVILFLSSVGMGVDRLIKKLSYSSPSRALLFQALGAERVESLCDEFCKFISREYGNISPRFSAGYGDLSLSVQKEIFGVLSPSKIGVTLGDDLIMSPLKSVTAFVGITDGKNCDSDTFTKCDNCKKEDCIFKVR